MANQGTPRSLQRFESFLERPQQALLLYLGLTLLMTFPLALSWRSALPAGSGDIWQNYWNFWWWKQCLIEGLNPLRSEMLYHPAGADLIFHTHSPFNQVLAMPVNLLFGEAAAYNFCLLFALTVAGFGTYLLVRELTGSAQAGFLAGLVFAFFPQTIEQTFEHLNLFSAEFIPLSAYYLLRWSRSLRLADALAFGACFGLNALCSWHLGLKLTLLVLPWVAWIAWRHRERSTDLLKGIGASAALAVLLVLPLLAPMVTLLADGSDYHYKGPVNRGIDPSYLLTPSHSNPVLGPVTLGRYLDRAYQAAGFVCYLGFVPVALAALGIGRAWRKSWPWLAALAIGIVLACGAHLLWNGTRFQSVPLPFALFADVPIFANLRVANRFMLLAALGLAVLTGIGWSAVRRRPVWALPVVAALILLEYSWLPFPVQKVEHSPLLARIADRPGAVLDVPFHQRARTVHNMVAQTVHGRPISGGYLSAYPPAVQSAIDGAPALRELAGVPEEDAVIDAESLRKLGFQTVLIHKYRAASVRDELIAGVDPANLWERKRLLRLGGVPDEILAAIRKQLDNAVGPAVFEDALVAIYFL